MADKLYYVSSVNVRLKHSEQLMKCIHNRTETSRSEKSGFETSRSRKSWCEKSGCDNILVQTSRCEKSGCETTGPKKLGAKRPGPKRPVPECSGAKRPGPKTCETSWVSSMIVTPFLGPIYDCVTSGGLSDCETSLGLSVIVKLPGVS